MPNPNPSQHPFQNSPQQSPNQPSESDQNIQQASNHSSHSVSHQHHPVGHHKPQPTSLTHANQQQHPYTHSSHAYTVSEIDESQTKAKHSILARHPILFPLLLVLFILLAIFAALSYTTQIGTQIVGWLGYQQNVQVSSSTPASFTIPTSGIILGTDQEQLIYEPETQNITQINSSVLSQLSLEAEIRAIEPGKTLLLIDKARQHLSIYSPEEGRVIQISDQIRQVHGSFQLFDTAVFADQNHTLIYAAIEITEKNVPHTILIEYNLASQQMRITRLQTGTNPKITWIHSVNRSVYLTSTISSDTQLLTVVTAGQQQSNTRVPYAFVGTASPQGRQLIITDGSLTQIMLFEPGSILESTVFQPSLDTISHVFWHTSHNRFTLALADDANTPIELVSLSTAGEILCRQNVQPNTKLFKHSLEYTLLSAHQNDTNIINLDSCQSEAGITIPAADIESIYGWY